MLPPTEVANAGGLLGMKRAALGLPLGMKRKTSYKDEVGLGLGMKRISSWREEL